MILRRSASTCLIPKLALKGLKSFLKQAQLQYHFRQSILYSQRLGISIRVPLPGFAFSLESRPQLVAGDRIALYGYGSGAVL